jgi:DNA-binding response OmpR family regulator
VAQEVIILIADRNPNVREFLKREMTAENYRVWVAEDAKSLLYLAFASPPPDLLILDPDLPDMESSEIINRLNERTPKIPTIIHSFPDEERNQSLQNAGVFIEKGSQSVEAVKKAIREMLAVKAK